jgi:hypothetical protein
MWSVRIAFLVILVAAAWVPAAADASSAVCLVISQDDPRKEIKRLPVEPGVEFHLEFINSIYRAPVRETMVYEPGQGIALTKVESPSAGVFEYYGLTTGKGQNGSGVLPIRRVVGEIRLRSHNYEHHRLVVGGRIVRLKGLVRDGEPLIIKIHPCGGKDSIAGGR